MCKPHKMNGMVKTYHIRGSKYKTDRNQLKATYDRLTPIPAVLWKFLPSCSPLTIRYSLVFLAFSTHFHSAYQPNYPSPNSFSSHHFRDPDSNPQPLVRMSIR